ncbi:hypothetical protein B0I35DRAFT_481935 [Stachybotrys elegans]|uniref:Mid2 domain-containing protein n=1 Tax=Stachybotrys elegans TaxID=80388 RepID=A0A8K0SKD1_9HYPO|nr:hypothetical protein B0I35DRAFT_481935 [Stachybotrys elegans]
MLALLALLPLALAMCYTPDGTPVPRDIPCNQDGGVSMCCDRGYFCHSNGICQPENMSIDVPNRFIRATCTDESWESPECVSFCTTANPGGGEWVVRCTNSTSTKASEWCCSWETCCEDNDPRIEIGDAVVIGRATFSASSSTQAPRSTSTSATTSEPQTTTTDETTSATIRPDETTSATTPPDETTTDTVPPASSGPPLPAQSESSGSSTNTLTIGLGVGLGVALLALVGGLVWWWLHGRPRPGRHGASDNGHAARTLQDPGDTQFEKNGAYAPGVYAPGGYAPGVYAPEGYAPGVYPPGMYASWNRPAELEERRVHELGDRPGRLELAG